MASWAEKIVQSEIRNDPDLNRLEVLLMLLPYATKTGELNLLEEMDLTADIDVAIYEKGPQK